jgi:FixJ family two-component response regulator
MSPRSAKNESPIVVVSADAAQRDAAATLLRGAGYEVETFVSATAILEGDAAARASCAVIDARLTGMSAFGLQEWLRENFPVPIVFIGRHPDITAVVRAVKQGAFEFLATPLTEAKLLPAVAGAIAEGKRAVSSAAYPPVVASLTRREREILDLVLVGSTTRAIAATLFISVKTVEFHRSRIYSKLGVSSLPQLFRLFLARARPPRRRG